MVKTISLIFCIVFATVVISAAIYLTVSVFVNPREKTMSEIKKLPIEGKILYVIITLPAMIYQFIKFIRKEERKNA